MSVLQKIILGTLPWVPLPIMRRLSKRYIAGETLQEAMDALARAQGQGFAGVLDILGEDVTDEDAARSALAQYKQGASAIHETGIDAYVSVKPTHFGLRISAELAFELYSELLTHCSELGQAARVEMEDHTTTDATIALHMRLREKHKNVGLVLQSRLFRTPQDIKALGAGPNRDHSDVRMVKGIYLEPGEIAHTEPGAIREAFINCTRQLWEQGHQVALATHDGVLAERLIQAAQELNIPSDAFCFEVLLGVQEQLWAEWRKAGIKVRVYVPFGPEWRSYSERRLRKNPEILKHIMRNLVS